MQQFDRHQSTCVQTVKKMFIHIFQGFVSKEMLLKHGTKYIKEEHECTSSKSCGLLYHTSQGPRHNSTLGLNKMLDRNITFSWHCLSSARSGL